MQCMVRTLHALRLCVLAGRRMVFRYLFFFMYVYETRSDGYEVSDFAGGMCRAAACLFW